MSLRPRLSEEVAWNPPAWAKAGDVGDAQRTPDLAALIRKVTRHPDWKPGNSLSLLISGVGKRVAGAREGDSKHAAKLIVDADKVLRAARRHRVRLFFGAPKTAGKCRFDVYLQDQRVLTNVVLDPKESADATSAIHTFNDIMIADQLRVRLAPKEGKPLLSGIEVICKQD